MLKLSWEEYQKMIEELTAKIKKSGLKFNGIYGVPRGGMIIAVSLSHKLNLPILNFSDKDTLLVDDISDEGKTLHHMKRKAIATLFSSEWTITNPEFYCDKKQSKDEWIIFPWENENELNQTKLTQFIK